MKIHVLLLTLVFVIKSQANLLDVRRRDDFRRMDLGVWETQGTVIYDT